MVFDFFEDFEAAYFLTFRKEFKKESWFCDGNSPTNLSALQRVFYIRVWFPIIPELLTLSTPRCKNKNLYFERSNKECVEIFRICQCRINILGITLLHFCKKESCSYRSWPVQICQRLPQWSSKIYFSEKNSIQNLYIYSCAKCTPLSRIGE